MASRLSHGRKAAPPAAAAQSAGAARYPSLEQFLRAVEEQRSKLINVLGSLECMSIAVSSGEPVELQGAIGLAHDELQRVLNDLDSTEITRLAAAVKLS